MLSKKKEDEYNIFYVYLIYQSDGLGNNDN